MWWLLLPFSLLIVVMRLTVPAFAGPGAIVQGVLLTLALIGAARASSSTRRARRAWTWLAAAQMCYVFGDMLFFAQRGTRPLFPGPGDAFYLAFYVLVCIGLVSQPVRTLTRTVQMRLELDVALIVAASSMIYGLLVFAGLRANRSYDSLLLLLYPTMDIVLVCTLAVMLLRQAVPTPAQLAYGVGVLLLTAADLLMAADQLHLFIVHDVRWFAMMLYAKSGVVVLFAALLEQRQMRWPKTSSRLPLLWRTTLRKLAPFWAEFLLPYGWTIIAIAMCFVYYGYLEGPLLQGDLLFLIGCMGLILMISVARQWLTLEENAGHVLRQSRLLHASHLLARHLDFRSAPSRVLEEVDGLVVNDESHLYLLREGQDMYVTGSGIWQGRSHVRIDMAEPAEFASCFEFDQPAVLSSHSDAGISARGAAVMRELLESTRRRLWPDGRYPNVCEWIVVPLHTDARLIGVLCIGSADGAWDVFDYLETVAAFARQAAATIDNVRMRQRQTEMAATAERSRLSRELHDSVLQAIFGCSLGLRTAQHYVDEKNVPAHEALSYSLHLVEGAISEMRALIFELRPETLANEGLFLALSKQAQSLCDRHSIQAVVRSDCNEPQMVYAAKETFYRIAIEALQNVIKHARARTVQIELRETHERVCMTINDDGIGFDTTLDYKGHLGLISMQERAVQIGAAFVLTSAPGSGTRIEVCMRSGARD